MEEIASIISDRSDGDSSLMIQTIHEPLVLSCGDDEDGELEVFSSAIESDSIVPLPPPQEQPKPNHRVSNVGSLPPPPPPQLQPNQTALIDAMSTSVAMVENNLPFEMPVVASRHPSVSPQSTALNIEPDMFGIKYRPYGKVQSGYALRSNDTSGFDDYVELVNASKTTILPSDDDAADDFDFDFDNGSQSFDNMPSVNILALGAIREAQEAADAREIVESLRSDAESLDLASAGQGVDVTKTIKLDIKEATINALTAIKEVYETGMGDFEVQLLPVDHALSASVAAVSCGTIEEGDEDEEELEEEQSAMRSKQNALEVSKIEAEWGLVGISSNDSIMQTISNIKDNDTTTLVAQVKITYQEFLSFLQCQDLSVYRSSILVRNPPKKATGIGSSLLNMVGYRKPAALNIPDAEEALALPFLFAQLDYDPNITEHHAVLQTIFNTLISQSHYPRGQHGVPPTGPHWEQIGFQGLDPRTDINRSMKVFALLQVLHLVDVKTDESLRLHELSNLQPGSSGQDLTWPFMCVSIMFTKEAIQALRSGILNQVINDRKDILSVLHDFHHACFHDFSQ